MEKLFGLDIGSDLIKVNQIERKKGSVIIAKVGAIKTPLTEFNLDSEESLFALAEAIKKVKSETRIEESKVALALPEKKVFTKVIELPSLNENELSRAVVWEAESVIPYQLAETNLDWEEIEEIDTPEGKKVRVFVAATLKSIIDRYLEILKMAELQCLSIEPESTALLRSLTGVIGERNALIIDLGNEGGTGVLVYKGRMAGSFYFPYGGKALTRAISSDLGLSLKEAEEFKRAYGLTMQLEGKVRKSILPVLDLIKNEIKKIMGFYIEKYSSELEIMILSGGTSLLPGLNEYFVENLGLEVYLVNGQDFPIPKVSEFESIRNFFPAFLLSYGLALKDI